MTGDPLGLIETMYADGAGIRFLARHLHRLAASAETLGLVCPVEEVETALRAAAVGLVAPRRIRLQLDPDGAFHVTGAALPPPPAGMPAVVVASQRVSADDVLLRHKTTRRAVYDAARAALPGDGSVLDALLLNQDGEVCEGAITNVFALSGGRLLTPPAACGLLPGIMRGHVIEAYGAREAVLRPADLAQAERLFLTNAVRGMIEVRLAPGPWEAPGGAGHGSAAGT